MCEDTSQKAIKSDCSETKVEDKSISRLNIDKDLEDEFILQGSWHIRELDTSDVLKRSVTEDLKHNSLEDSQKHRIYNPVNNLESSTVNAGEQCVDNVKGLRVSDVQKQQTWLARVIRPSPKEMGYYNETKQRNKKMISPQIQGTIIDYTEDLIQKTAQEVQMEYDNEKMNSKKVVDILKQRISLLKSELQEVKRAYRKVAEQLNIFKTFFSQKQTVARRNSDMDPDLQMMPVVSEKLTLPQQKYAVEKEHMDVTLECNRTKLPEMERNFVVNENNINEKKFLKCEKTLSKAVSLSLKQTIQKHLPSKKILQDSKNKFVSNDSKHGNTEFQKKLGMETRSLKEALSCNEKL